MLALSQLDDAFSERKKQQTMKLLIKGLFEFAIQQLKFRNLIFLVIPLCLLALLVFGRVDGNKTDTPMANGTRAAHAVKAVQTVIISDNSYVTDASANSVGATSVETSMQLADQTIAQSGSDGAITDDSMQGISEVVRTPQSTTEINQAQVESSTSSSGLEPVVRLIDTIATVQPSGDKALDDAAALEVDRIVIPAIDLDSAVVELGWHINRDASGQIFSEWDFANNAAGWHKNSALPGEGGNVVMSGHNNIMGAVFRELDQLDEGDEVFVYSGVRAFMYEIERVMVVPEVYADAAQRAANAQWIEQFDDNRITLVSCWPRDDNSHRIIVIGYAVTR